MLRDLLANCTLENREYLQSLPEPVQEVVSRISGAVRGFLGVDYNTINKIIIPTLMRRSKLPHSDINSFVTDLDKRIIVHRQRTHRGAIAPLTPPAVVLSEIFASVEAELLTEWSVHQTKTPSIYHLDGHGDEMATDSKSFAKREAIRLFSGISKARIRDYFCSISKLAHATHDLIQDLGPVANEIATYELVRDRAKHHLESSGIKEDSNPILFLTIDHTLWEAIVVGTTFNFIEQVPIIYYINNINSGLAPVNRFKCPAHISAIQLAMAVNDTRRCSQLRRIMPEYDPSVVFLHMNACRGEDNHFLQFAKVNQLSSGDITRSEVHIFYLQMSHLFGQNIRAKLELMLKNLSIDKLSFLCSLLDRTAPGEPVLNEELFLKIERFCLYLKSALLECSNGKTEIPDISKSNLSEYFELFISMMRKEVDFAKGFSREKLEHLITSHHALLELDNISYDMENLNEWEIYALVLERYLESVSSDSLTPLQTLEIMTDWVLLGANQIGNFSLSTRNDYLSLLANKARDDDGLVYKDKYRQIGKRIESQQRIIRNTNLEALHAHALAPVIMGIHNPTDDTPWNIISFALSNRLSSIKQSFLLGKKMQEAAVIFLGTDNPLSIWLTHNINNIHSRNTLIALVRSISASNNPGFLIRYVCCCFYQETIHQHELINEALRKIARAREIKDILRGIDALNSILTGDRDSARGAGAAAIAHTDDAEAVIRIRPAITARPKDGAIEMPSSKADRPGIKLF